MSGAFAVCDIAFVGHVCRDEVVSFGGRPAWPPGSAVPVRGPSPRRGSERGGGRDADVPADTDILLPMRDLGIAVAR